MPSLPRCAAVVALLLAASGLAAITRPLGGQTADPSLRDDDYARARYLRRVVRMPMRDGALLFTQLFVPRDAGSARRYPIVLTRTPFSTGAESSAITGAIAPDPYMLRDGYIFVQQEVRGRYRSDGVFENVRPSRRTSDGVDETTDAEDTIDWLLANVPGHNGRVGLHGTSYGGFYAALAARSRHPAIRALSLQAPVADYWREDFHHNGAFVLTSLWAVPIFGTPRSAPTAAHWWAAAYGQIPDSAMADDYRWLAKLGGLGNVSWLENDRWWRELVAHPDDDAFWRARALPPRLAGLTIPTLLVGGWFDAENLNGTLAVQRALAARAPGAPVTFVMGPFGHRQWSARNAGPTVHGALYFGDSLETRFQRDVEAPFFRDRLLTEAAPERRVQLFDTGRHAWRTFSAWPAPERRETTWAFAPGGRLNERSPRLIEPGTRTWTSDPASPVPSRCHGTTIEEGSPNLFMSDDQRCVSTRPDVVTFTSPVLARDVTLAGPITARLRFATTGTDADIVVKIIDVFPDDAPDPPVRPDTSQHFAGRQQLVRAEILRGRYRRGGAAARPFAPNVAETVSITLPDVLHTLRAGHRLMVQVHSTWFPLFDRNPQRFVSNIFRATRDDFAVAQQTLSLGGAAGSVLRLPIIP